MLVIGLVSRVVPSERLLEESFKIANKIASHSQPIGMCFSYLRKVSNMKLIY